MGISEQAFVVLLLVAGVGFQVRMWRELAAKKPRGRSTKEEQPGVGFYPFGLVFCCAVEALAAHAYMTSRFESSALAITVAILTASVCLGIAFGIAHLRPTAK